MAARGAADNRYCNIQVRTWDDAKVKKLSRPEPNGLTLWLYLLSGPFTTRIPGVIHGGRAAMAERLRWPVEQFDRCFAEIESMGMAIADWGEGVVYLPTAFQHEINKPTSTSTCVTWRRVIRDLPECELVLRIDHDIRMILVGIGPQYLQSYVNSNRADQKTSTPISTEHESKVESKPVSKAESSVSLSPSPSPSPSPLPKGSSADADAAQAELFGSPPKADKQPEAHSKPDKPPLPFKPDEAMAMLQEASNGRFIASTLNKGQSIAVTGVIRKYPDRETWMRVGSWLGRGGDGFMKEGADVRNIGSFDVWVAKSANQSQAPPGQREYCNYQAPRAAVTEGKDVKL